jgi:hypothetical protein
VVNLGLIWLKDLKKQLKKPLFLAVAMVCMFDLPKNILEGVGGQIKTKNGKWKDVNATTQRKNQKAS